MLAFFTWRRFPARSPSILARGLCRTALGPIVFTIGLTGSGCASSPVARAPVLEASPKAGHSAAAKVVRKPGVKAKSGAASVLREQAQAWFGVPYRYGGTSRRGVDCSAFVQITLRDRLGIDVPRTTRDQIQVGRAVSRKELVAGDLVFFRTGRGGRHVGIYLGEREFVHVSQRAGVVVSKIDSSYWQNAYWQARRLESNS